MQRIHATFTGADDKTNPFELRQLSTTFGPAELGILHTIRHGRPLFPSNAWIERLRRLADGTMRLSAHICSTWAKQICTGVWPRKLNVEGFQRVQLNIARHLQEDVCAESIYRCLPAGHEYIVQAGRGRERALVLAYRLQELGARVSVLFDASGGNGLTPRQWPRPAEGLHCGYAGGLGPDNLERELGRLTSVIGNRPAWIDMQKNVRTADGTRFDLSKVRACLEICAAYSQPLTAPASDQHSELQ